MPKKVKKALKPIKKTKEPPKKPSKNKEVKKVIKRETVKIVPTASSFSLTCVVDEVNGGWVGYYDCKSGRLLAQGYKVSELELLEHLGFSIEFLNIDTEDKLKAVGKDLPERLNTLKKRLGI